MSKKKLARMTRVCTIAIMLIGVIIIFPSCLSITTTTPTLVTYNCTTSTTTSITAQGQVTKTGGLLLSTRGFVYMEGTEGDPVLDSVNLSNPSFESGDPPQGWSYRNSTQVSRVSDAKVGNYSLKYQYPGVVGYPYVRANPGFNVTDWGGKILTFAAWVKSDTASVHLTFMDLAGNWWSTGSYHPGDNQWHYITCRATIPTNLTANWTVAILSWNTTASYTFWVDDVVLVENAVFAGGSFDVGNYTLAINQLKPATSYRIRAFGENDKGISYGNTVTCQTQ
jgi:hypothetical protein